MINYRLTVSGGKDLAIIVIDSKIPLTNEMYQSILKKLTEVNLDEHGNQARPAETADATDFPTGPV